MSKPYHIRTEHKLNEKTPHDKDRFKDGYYDYFWNTHEEYLDFIFGGW